MDNISIALVREYLSRKARNINGRLKHKGGIDKTWTVDYGLDCGLEPGLNYGPKVAQNHSEDFDSKILIIIIIPKLNANQSYSFLDSFSN